MQPGHAAQQPLQTRAVAAGETIAAGPRDPQNRQTDGEDRRERRVDHHEVAGDVRLTLHQQRPETRDGQDHKAHHRQEVAQLLESPQQAVALLGLQLLPVGVGVQARHAVFVVCLVVGVQPIQLIAIVLPVGHILVHQVNKAAIMGCIDSTQAYEKRSRSHLFSLKFQIIEKSQILNK